MTLFQSAQNNVAIHEQVVGHRPSYDLSWTHPDIRPPSVPIQGRVWTRGVFVWRRGMTSVWATPGLSGEVGGYGLGVMVNF